MSGELLLY